ncbi:unnamed protein product [Moneuplotes crassus]|uniref:Uncharacterized protein n=1 Tax=Euplotes crassus TaxID=5936 RepID=A0AAD1X7L0_EUPCR|nr:unnamed protein product [Moneuplotes crassus]
MGFEGEVLMLEGVGGIETEDSLFSCTNLPKLFYCFRSVLNQKPSVICKMA